MKRSSVFILLGMMLVSIARGDSFDYYTLAVTMTPAFCDLNPKHFNSVQCRERKPLSVHGLWPEKARSRAPEYCSGSAFKIAPETEKQLRRIMPDSGLRRYQWEKHGRCSQLSADSYFGIMAREFDELKWPDMFRASGRDVVVERNVVVKELQRLNPRLTSSGIVLRCSGKGRPPLLTEVRVCLSAQGAPMACSQNARSNCPVAVRIRSWR